MTESGKQLPDNYVPNAYALPYGSNLSAPAIKPDHTLGGWKVGAVHSANQHYEERFNKLKAEGLKAYEKNIAKEGVGAGGSSIAAILKNENINTDTLLVEIEKNYDILMSKK